MEMLKHVVERYRGERYTELADWMERNVPEGLAVSGVVESDFARRRLEDHKHGRIPEQGVERKNKDD